MQQQHQVMQSMQRIMRSRSKDYSNNEVPLFEAGLREPAAPQLQSNKGRRISMTLQEKKAREREQSRIRQRNFRARRRAAAQAAFSGSSSGGSSIDASGNPRFLQPRKAFSADAGQPSALQELVPVPLGPLSAPASNAPWAGVRNHNVTVSPAAALASFTSRNSQRPPLPHPLSVPALIHPNAVSPVKYQSPDTEEQAKTGSHSPLRWLSDIAAMQLNDRRKSTQK